MFLNSWHDFKKRINKDPRGHKPDFYAKYFVRKLSGPITYILVKTPITANQVTVLQEIMGVLGAILLATTSIKWMIIGIVLLQLGYVLDLVDGEVARYKGQQSVRGVYLDLIGHQFVIPMYIFFNSLGVYLRTGNIDAVIFGFLGALFVLRTDFFSLLSVINTMIGKGDNRSFNIDILNHEESGESVKYAVKNRDGWKWTIRKKWAYPDSMNMLTIFIFIEWLVPVIQIQNYQVSPTYIFVYLFSIPIIIGRLVRYKRVFANDLVVKHFRFIVHQIKSKF